MASALYVLHGLSALYVQRDDVFRTFKVRDYSRHMVSVFFATYHCTGMPRPSCYITPCHDSFIFT